MNQLQKQLVAFEGLRLLPYECTAGKITIGVGRNIEDIGITEEEAMILLDNDIERVRGELDRAIPWWQGLTETRRNVLIDMCFNLGISRLMQFKKALSAIEAGDYELGATEMLDSAWSQQVGARSHKLAESMRTDTPVEI